MSPELDPELIGDQVVLLRRAVAMAEESSLLINRAVLLGEPSLKDRAVGLMEDAAAIMLTVGMDLAEAGL